MQKRHSDSNTSPQVGQGRRVRSCPQCGQNFAARVAGNCLPQELHAGSGVDTSASNSTSTSGSSSSGAPPLAGAIQTSQFAKLRNRLTFGFGESNSKRKLSRASAGSK